MICPVSDFPFFLELWPVKCLKAVLSSNVMLTFALCLWEIATVVSAWVTGEWQIEDNRSGAEECGEVRCTPSAIEFDHVLYSHSFSTKDRHYSSVLTSDVSETSNGHLARRADRLPARIHFLDVIHFLSFLSYMYVSLCVSLCATHLLTG